MSSNTTLHSLHHRDQPLSTFFFLSSNTSLTIVLLTSPSMSQLFKTTCKLITHGVDPPAIVTIETTSSSKTTVDKDNYTLVRNLTPAEHYERKMMILTITIVAFLTSSALCFGMGWHQASPLVERCTQDEGGVGDAIAWMLILMFLLTSYAFIFAMGWKFGNPLNARKASNGTNGRADAIQLLFLLLFLINFGTWYFTGWALASGQPGRLKREYHHRSMGIFANHVN